ncbi:putative RNA-directed DNA polymerase from transposon X-element [Portunus trituberculatus]|uniref:Putative RNA-directed DNA polymerase from transposon X-element n=1 Tax=Portunus trituberculatus TaxID=210409 RepID=A0A5B7GUQ5_PORTR|nr:putative RNA-directed DNA polymerase from transposon X-element [Portunus trituberculatus]
MSNRTKCSSCRLQGHSREECRKRLNLYFSSLGPAGSSDHEAVFTRIPLRRPQDESATRTFWQWEKADWAGFRRHLSKLNCDSLLQGDVDQQDESFTKVLLGAQARWVPHKQHRRKASDQPWFGPQYRTTSDRRKFWAWQTYKRHPTSYNRAHHSVAAANMEATQLWTKNHWVEDKEKAEGQPSRLKTVVGPCQGQPRAKNKAVLVLDIAGALDHVWHAALLEKLHAVGVDGVLLQLLRDYLQGRHMQVVHNGQQSSPHRITAGVPQGSVLVPLL